MSTPVNCEKHGRTYIIQISERLKNSYDKRNKTKVLKLIFKATKSSICPESHYYFDASENLTSLMSFTSEEDFERKSSKISGNPVACNKCFFEYLKEHKITLQEKLVFVPI